MNNVKNYVVGQHYKVKSTQWSWKDTKDEGDQYVAYKKMYQLSRASLTKFLEGPWEEICFEGEIDFIGQAAKKSLTLIKELWHKEPCNILVLGPDCQMVQNTKIFDQFNEFRMFNWTDPKSHDGNNPWNYSLPNYFNGDMLYYPHTLTSNFWEKFDSLCENWVIDNTVSTWGNDQIVNNILFWEQGLTWEQAHQSKLFYQAQWIPIWAPIEIQDQWNGCLSTEAHIIHWHASRHIPTKLAAMENINEVLDIPEYVGILK